MPRYALKVEYQGEPFAGWQRQKELSSVQGAIEQALSRIQPGAHTIAAAGRTDAGVHALGQVAHCDLVKEWDPFRLSEALNYHLKPQPVAIVKAARVDDDWHARFSALERQYLFRILMRRAPATHDAGQVWQINHRLDVNAMQAGADMLIGRHDFTTFRSSICQAASPVKTLDELRVEQVRDFPAPKCISTSAPGPSYTIRCGVLSARWNASAQGHGHPKMCGMRWRLRTVRPVARFARRRAFIWHGSDIQNRSSTKSHASAGHLRSPRSGGPRPTQWSEPAPRQTA